ncbi:FmdB family zinc ribbon protein [Rhodanobacter sp. UC4436_H3]
MPIYEFECSGCGHRFDRLQKLSDADPTVCPACAAAKLHRRVSAPAFRLAGSGWYETDFKKDGEKKHNLAGTTAGEGSKSAPEGKPASAPEASTAKPAAPAKAAAAAD